MRRGAGSQPTVLRDAGAAAPRGCKRQCGLSCRSKIDAPGVLANATPVNNRVRGGCNPAWGAGKVAHEQTIRRDVPAVRPDRPSMCRVCAIAATRAAYCCCPRPSSPIHPGLVPPAACARARRARRTSAAWRQGWRASVLSRDHAAHLRACSENRPEPISRAMRSHAASGPCNGENHTASG